MRLYSWKIIHYKREQYKWHLDQTYMLSVFVGTKHNANPFSTIYMTQN